MVGNPLERMLRKPERYEEPQNMGIPDLPVGYIPDQKPSYVPPQAPSYSYSAPAAPAVQQAMPMQIQSGAGMRIGIVVSEFNFDITYMMLENAREYAGFLGASVTQVVKVPGVFDMPLAIKKLLKRADVDGVVTLGAVIEGETDHDQIVIQHASRKAADLSLEYEKPVALGITGPGMTRLQAQDRVDRAKAGVESVVKMWQRTRDL
jgi:6,7-dimethyl-8-ribityllumazine synthase